MARTKAISLTFLALFLAVLFSAKISSAAVIFQDDFEFDPSNWECKNTQGNYWQLSKWSPGSVSCGYTAGFGNEWKMGPGRNSNNAVYAWKNNQVPNGYRSESQKWLYGSDLKTEIYHRWYMKIPPPSQFDKSTASASGACKLWRYILRENGFKNPDGSYGLAPELYLQLAHWGPAGDQRISNSWTALLDSITGGTWLLKLNSEQMDGLWHSHELHIKVNSIGNSDGIVEYWFDGVKKGSWTGINFGFDDRQPLAFHRFGVGMGNCADEPWDQTTWSAIAFDDVVVSTSYIGPTGTLPSPYCGDLSCNNGETCSTCPGDCGACQTCGNSIREGSEACDGSDLAGQSCISRGFTGGNLACSSNCMSFDTSGCTSSSCGNTICDSGETCSNCPQDCGQCTSQNPIAHWKFDEGSGTITSDSSGNNNTGTLVNGPVWTTGKIGGALSFDGSNDYVNVSDNPSLDITDNITLMAWIYPKSASGVSNYKGIITKRYASQAHAYGLSLGTWNWADSKLTFDFYSGGYRGLSTDDNLSLDQWSHVAVTYDRNSMALYVNGVQVKASYENAALITNDYPVRIGTGQSQSDIFAFNGTIDDVRIYSRALSPEEIQALYNSAQTFHKSDTDQDGCVSGTELSDFIDLWHLDSSNPTIRELIEAIGMWKGGC